jgi:outer membrane protein
LLDLGGRAAGQRAAQAQLDAAVASLEATALKTQSDVTSAYFDAQSAKASLAAQKDLQDLALQTLQTLGRMQERGAAAQGQTMQAAAELAKIRLSMSRARAALAKSLTELSVQMALAQDAAPVLQDTNPDAALGLSTDLAQQLQADLSDLYAQAQAQHPDIVAAQAQLLAAQERLGASTSEGRPTLDLAVNYYENGRPNQSLSGNKTQETLAGLTLNIPLFDGFASTYKVRRAEADLERAQAALVDAKQRVYASIDKAQSQARNALESMEFATEWEKAATELAASTQRKLERGAADLSEYLRTRSSVLEAQQERWRSLAEWQSAAQQLLSSTAAVKGVVYRKP